MQGGPSPQDFVPIFGMITGVLITGMFLLGPVGRAIGDAIRHWLGGGRKDAAALSGEDVEELREELRSLRGQLGELAERQDFAERLLAQARERGALGPGPDR